MSFSTTIVFYLLIGTSVSFAVILSNRRASRIERFFHGVAAAVFWPIYLPGLLHRNEANQRRVVSGETSTSNDLSSMDEFSCVNSPSGSDDIELAITQVEEELDTALQCLDSWAEDFLAPENDRFSELRRAWRIQASRIRELDGLLSQPAFGSDVVSPNDREAAPPASNDRIRTSQQSRRENVERLRGVRQQMHRDLMGTLAWVRELVTLIHLAKYTGAPASRAEELVAQIAAAVEGLSQVANWQQPVSAK